MSSMMWEIAEKYMSAKHGETWEVFAIDKAAPVKSVRENVAMYLDEHIKVSNDAARDIISEIESYGYKWMTHKPTGITFITGDPNHFIVAAASIIEM